MSVFFNVFFILIIREVREVLEEKLKKLVWEIAGKKQGSLWDFYVKYWIEFGELLTEMEREGIKIDMDFIKTLEPRATQDLENADLLFRLWAQQYSPGAIVMNISSDLQKRQLLFSPIENIVSKEFLPKEKEFKHINNVNLIEEGKKKPMKHLSFSIEGFGLPCTSFSKSGWPQTGIPVLKELAGNPVGDKPRYGTAFDHFGGGEDGIEACEAINQLCEHGSISTLLNSFIIPLQEMADKNNRIHASLNINTETGRLSCRRPNLQNQPALEKDRYKIRRAFQAEKGNKLIVADYGQLELRLLAHITNCKSMIDAFKQGGDFHSRTAIGMYTEIQTALKNGEVILEWDYSTGKQPDVPLIKDVCLISFFSLQFLFILVFFIRFIMLKDEELRF